MESTRIRRLVHLSDLHFGASPRLEARTAAVVDDLVARNVDHVVVTGDMTEHGTNEEFERFCRVFEPLAQRRRLTVIPGNHDRLGDDVAELTMGGQRVRVERRDGLHLVLVDSTRTNPGFAFVAHGRLDDTDLAAIDRALRQAAPGSLVCVLLHHHPLAMPHESWLEALGDRVGLPFGQALDRGEALVALARGRADLVLHGHRHRPRGTWIEGARPLGIFNAGCSPQLGCGREFLHRGGAVLRGWHEVRGGSARSHRRDRVVPPPSLELPSLPASADLSLAAVR